VLGVARIGAILAMLLAGTAPLAAFDGPTQSKGGEKKSTAPDPKADEKAKAASTAERMLEAGIKAYQDGKNKQALRAFDAALNGGALQSPQMARALYYRGLVHRKAGNPGLAIPDFTSAIWLKNGLSPSEKQDALAQRVAAYKDAGVSDAPGLGGAGQEAVVASEPGAPASIGTAGGDGWQTAAANATPSTYVPPPPPAGTPAPAASSSSSSSSGGIGGFFNTITGGIFSGGSSSAPNADDGAVTTASIAAAPAPPPHVEVSSWSMATQVEPATGTSAPPAPEAVAAAAPASEPAPVAAPAYSGKYRLQVGSVRSRPEADLLVAKVLTDYGGELGGRDPEVEKSVVGNMGTFFLVRVGPYADEKEPKQLCTTMQTNGYDCFVVMP
jgi:tetratricopeptide (TPR) repeat protein